MNDAPLRGELLLSSLGSLVPWFNAIGFSVLGVSLYMSFYKGLSIYYIHCSMVLSLPSSDSRSSKFLLTFSQKSIT